MAEEREFYDEEQGTEPEDTPDLSAPDTGAEDEQVPLRSTEDFERELEVLEASAGPEEPEAEGDIETLSEAMAALPDEPVLPTEPPEDFPVMPVVAEPVEAEREAAQEVAEREERVRQPRAQSFRRRLRHQIGVLPLALGLIALGAYLLAREHNLADVPDFSTPALAGMVVLGLGFTFIFHALVFGRRERGLLVMGLYIWATAGVIAAIVYGIDEHPDATEWWPALIWSLAIALFLTYLIERTHDVRLVWLAALVAVAGGAAYWVSSGAADQALLDQVADYWPLVLAAVGLILLPAAFRRQTR
ncbi:MAG: hypothetical protein Kow00106_20350 [Anaerolineae bacterium]